MREWAGLPFGSGWDWLDFFWEWVGLVGFLSGVGGIDWNSFVSWWDWSEFLYKWVDLDQIPVGVGGIKKNSHTHIQNKNPCEIKV